MDINSLLSPQDSPAGSPSPRSSPVATRRTKPQPPGPNVRASPLSQAHAPPSSSDAPFARPAMPSPPINSLTLNQAQPTATSSPAMGSPRQLRQTSTSGMDTLADLASMQHHQRTARNGSGSLKRTESYEKHMANPHVRPSLQAIARTHSGSRSTLDIHMADAPTQTPPPRTFRSSSLSDANLQQVGQLTAYLAENPSAYESHVQLLKVLHQGFLSHVFSSEESPSENDPRTYDLLGDLQQAREAMSSRFTMGEELWIERLYDEQLLAKTLDDCLGVIESYSTAVAEEVGSTKLWNMYGEWMLSLYVLGNPSDQEIAQVSNPVNQWITLSEEDQVLAMDVFSKSQVVDVWKNGADHVKYNLSDSHTVWDKYMELKLESIGTSLSPEDVASIKNDHVERLQLPHATWDDTFQRFSNFVSEYENSSYESIMVEMNSLAADAKAKYAAREANELKLSRAVQSGDKTTTWTVLKEYLDWEMSHNRRKKTFSFELANALFQRAVLLFPSDTEIWQDHLMLLNEESEHLHRHVDPLPILGRACGHCPWSGKLWSHYIQAAEHYNLPFPDISQIKHKATSTGLLDSTTMEDLLEIHKAWCSFLRRRAFQRDSTDEDSDVAEVGILSAIEDTEKLGESKYGKDYKGDPHYRLERIYIKFLSQVEKYDRARERWAKLASRHGDSFEFWLRYYYWEMITWGKLTGNPDAGYSPIPRQATRVLQQAAKRPSLDWPEKVLDTYLVHCEDHEEASEIEVATLQWRRAMKHLSKRREKEALQAAEYAAQQQAQAQLEAAQQNGEQNGQASIGKRKREEGDYGDTDQDIKKTRADESVSLNEEPKSLPTQSALKRDRENTTVIVKNLPINALEKRIRHFFRDCGTIKSVTLSSSEGVSSKTATIEFDSRDDALAAQTKDQKLFEENVIGVQLGTGATIYVTNYPPSADEAYMRKLFDKYGEIIDIRLPSIKYNKHRRFCYIQFESPGQAQAATELHETLVEGDLKISVQISNPAVKEKRHGAMYEGREVYAANVDWNATEGDLKEVFSKYGKVESLRILKNESGRSKGTAFVKFTTKDEANSALELNNTKFKSRILTVSIATANPKKRQTATLISSRNSASPAPETAKNSSVASPASAASPHSHPITTDRPTHEEIASKTIALLNVPDTVNDARIRSLMEPYGPLRKIILRPSHQGCIVEFQDAVDAGKAGLGIAGFEIAPDRKLEVGSIADLMKQKEEKKDQAVVVGKGAQNGTTMQAPAPIRRPGQSGGGRRGGLGLKRGGATSAAGSSSGQANGDAGRAKKSNADFKAMFVKGSS